MDCQHAGDPLLTNHFSDPNNPWMTSSCETWNEITNRHQMKGRTETLNGLPVTQISCPENMRQGWIGNSVMVYCTLVHFELPGP